MSRSTADPHPTSAPEAARRRRWSLPRAAVRTVFLQPEAAWSYGADDEAPQRIEPAADWPAHHAGANVRLVLGGALTHQLVLTDASLPIDDPDALVKWARHQFVHYHGKAAQAWPLAPWMAPGQRGVSAAHGVDLEATRRDLAEHGVHLRAMQPWWAVALQAATRTTPTLALAAHAELWLIEGGLVTRVLCASGAVVGVEPHWLERRDAAALATLIARLCSSDRAPWVLGYGLASDGVHALAARRLGHLGGESPTQQWLRL